MQDQTEDRNAIERDALAFVSIMSPRDRRFINIGSGDFII